MIHEKIMNMRTDFLNELSTSIIKNYDIIYIEDLNTKGLLCNHKLAKFITDVSQSSFVNKVKYKAKWYGKEIIKVDRFIHQVKYALYVGIVMARKLLI